MRQMVNLALRSEYSFKSKHTYGRISDLLKHTNDTGLLGIGDVNGTYGFIQFEVACKEAGVKPIYSVRLMVMEDKNKKERKASGPEYIFIAKNVEGYREINQLTKSAYENFYYKPFALLSQVLKLSNNVIVIAENFVTPERIDFISLTTTTPRMMLDWDIPKVATDQTYPMHILSTDEWYRIWKDESAIDNTHEIAGMCDVEIPVAEMVKYPRKKDIKTEAIKGAKAKGIDLSGVYGQQLDRELEVIMEKGYVDYFLVVSDMIKFAKRTMLVGPSRGSCAGSLVCYLLDITEIDPIIHGLIFERFIDLNRHDLPDIDIDFPDNKRQDVINYLIRTYGKENVCHIANINRMKAKSAIGETAMALSVPYIDAEIVKESIVDRSGGDARAKMAARDTLESTQIGKDFMEKYPAMEAAFDLEMHATHTGKHAGGIIVCNDDITKYSGMNTRDGCVMMNKKDAEIKNLLKIDVLGLRTLTILEEAAGLAGFDFRDYYEMPLDIKGAFDVFNEMRLSGIFQFEGQAMMMLCKEMGVHSFDDIVALTALARPGPLHSGGANTFIKRRIGAEPIEYASNHEYYKEETANTYGVIVYQEQLMNICRKLGNMSWEEVSDIRRATSKTLGKEFFGRYEASFRKGCKENGISDAEAGVVWETMMTFGSYSMNKAHTVAYGLVSYWCAFMKYKFPLEFAAAIMNHTKNVESALIVLRDLKENEGIDYIDVDPDISEVNWTIHNGKLLGGLTNIVGLAEKTAQQIVALRKAGKPLKPAMYKKLISAPTPYQILYPVRHWWGDLFDRPGHYGLPFKPTVIRDIEESGEYIIVAQVKQKDVRDLNEYNELMKRGGKVLEKHDKFLRLVMEDDTGKMLCKIDRFKYEEMNGAGWSEKIVTGKTWLILKGEVKQGWRVLNINAIFDLEELDYDGPHNIVLERQQRKNKVLGNRVGL